jgi:hypothetical protein
MNVPTPIADMITEMHASGIQFEMIVVAVRSMERALSTRQKVDETAEKRRAWDREYRRNKRYCPPDPPDIHPTPPDVGSDALSSLGKEDSCSEVKSKKERKTRGTKIPPDWRAKQSHYEEGEKRGLSRLRVDELADNMRTWCAANANRSVTTKADWDATFMGFIRRERNGAGSSQNRADTAAGRATARETDFVARVGGSALRYLENRNAAGPVREVSRDSVSSSGNDAEQDSLWADYQSRCGAR